MSTTVHFYFLNSTAINCMVTDGNLILSGEHSVGYTETEI